MKIEILPDPQKPLGGSAVIRVSGANGVPSKVSLSVFDRSRDRWLADQTWQAVPVRFGPYPVTPTSDGGEFTIGSEIVDHIAEYTPLTLVVGKSSFDVDWPDTIMEAPGSPPIGGIMSADDPDISLSGTRETPRRPSPVAPKRVVEPDIEDEPAPPPIDDAIEPIELEEPQRSNLPLILGGLALAAVLAGGVAYYLMSQDGGDQASLCTAAALDAVPASDTLERLNQCRGEIDAQAAFRLVERGYRGGDAEATFAMGQLYDDDVKHALLEGRFGLGYPENLANAARYYAKAQEVGTEGAEAALRSVCDRAATATDALVRENVGVYCP